MSLYAGSVRALVAAVLLEGGKRGCVDSHCRCRPQEAADAVTLRERQLRGASWCAGSPAEPSAGRALAARPRAAVHCNSPPSIWIGARLWRLWPLRSRLRWSSRLGALIVSLLLPGCRAVPVNRAAWWLKLLCVSLRRRHAKRRISSESSRGGACDGLHTACVRCDRARVDRASHTGPATGPTVPGTSSWCQCCARVRASWREASEDMSFIHRTRPWLILKPVSGDTSNYIKNASD